MIAHNLNYSNNFINQIFDEHLSEQEKLIVAEYINNLLTSIDNGTGNAFLKEVDLLKDATNNIITQTAKPLKDEEQSIQTIYTKLQKSRKILIHHPLAFICTELKFNTYNQSTFDKYKVYVLLCAVRLNGSYNTKNSFDKTLNEIRQLAIGKRDYLLPHLPQNKHLLSLAHLLNELNKRRHNKEYSSSIRQNLSHYFYLFDHAYNYTRVISRKRTNSDPRKGDKIILAPSHSVDEDDEGKQLFELKKFNKTKSRSDKGWQAEEANTSQSDKQTITVIHSKDNNVYEKQQRAIQAQAITNRIKMRKQSLACDFKILTIFEVNILITACWHEITEKTDKSENALLLLLSLLCGRSPEEIITRQRKKRSKFIYCKKKNCWVLRIVHKTDTFYQEHAVSHLLSKVSPQIEIALPKGLTLAMGKKFKFPITVKMNNFLTYLNKKYKTRLSLNRIASYFVDYNKAQNKDDVVVEVILGLDSLHNSGMPYSHISSSMIITVFVEYYTHLQAICINNHGIGNTNGIYTLFTVDIANIVVTTDLGSPLFISDDEIIRANDLNIGHIKELQAINSQHIAFHNQFVFYIYKMLTMASGYRPVSGTGGKLSDICLDSGQFWISDKENRPGISARCIVLPTVVITQIKIYLHYLEKLSARFNLRNAENYNHIQKVIDGTEHLLFLFDTKTEKITEITPKTIRPYMDGQFPIALNWHRHYIRSKLMERSVDPALINTFMGHEEIGQEGLGRFSGLGYLDFKQLAQLIETILQTLHFKAIAYE